MLGLPKVIRQNTAAHTEFERVFQEIDFLIDFLIVFQEMDKDSDRAIGWDEFVRFFGGPFLLTKSVRKPTQVGVAKRSLRRGQMNTNPIWCATLIRKSVSKSLTQVGAPEAPPVEEETAQLLPLRQVPC